VGGDKVVVLTNAGSGLFVSNATYTVGSDSVAVVAADVNGDGKPDVIAVNRSGSTLSVLTNNGTGAFGSNTTLNASSEPNALAVADINGDGRVDLISGNSGCRHARRVDQRGHLHAEVDPQTFGQQRHRVVAGHLGELDIAAK